MLLGLPHTCELARGYVSTPKSATAPAGVHNLHVCAPYLVITHNETISCFFRSSWMARVMVIQNYSHFTTRDTEHRLTRRRINSQISSVSAITRSPSCCECYRELGVRSTPALLDCCQASCSCKQHHLLFYFGTELHLCLLGV